MKVAMLTPFYASAIFPEERVRQLGLRIQHPYTWVTNLAEGLVRQGMQVHVVTMSREFGSDFIFEKNGVTYDFLMPASRLVRGLTFFDSDKWRIHRFLECEQFSIVHGQGMNAYGYFGATSRLPNIVTIHLWADGIKGIIREYGRTCSSLFALRWSREILNRARNVISISPLVKKRLSVRGRKIRIFDIENAVHPRFFEELASPAEDFALYVGSIVPRKCVLELLEAVHSIGVKLKIVSTTISGEYYLAVREFVTKHNLSGSVEFLGPKRNDELAEIVQRCLFLVLPSKKEMAPMVISEAMAAGKPVVASAVDGIPFMIDDGNTGYLFPVGEIQELAAKMKILFYDRKLCRRMGKKAKDMAMERWHPDIIAHQTVMAYQQVLNGYHR